MHLAVTPSHCVFTQGLDQMELPVRHGEGKFFAAPEVLTRDRGQGPDRPEVRHRRRGRSRRALPGQSQRLALDMAGVCDATGRVLGLMPHPEAYVTAFQHPTWTAQKETWRRQGLPYPEQEGAGLAIFRNAVDYLQGRGLDLTPRRKAAKKDARK